MNAHGRHLKLVLLGAALATALACGGDSGVTDPGSVPPPPPPPPAKVLLKDIVVDRLPSPFYHFAYDQAGTITGVSYASELMSYDVSYLGTRIREMQTRDAGNRVRLVYAYDADGRVTEVRYVDATGATFTLVDYTYEGDKLTGVERSRRVSSGGLAIDKTMSLTYWPDGNLKDLAQHRVKLDGLQDESNIVTRFENYDDGINVDGFGLVHDDFFDHFVLLPGVVLQKHNPRKETRTGDGLTYTVDYTYAYDGEKRPVTKRGELVITGGGEVGTHAQTGSVFTYY
jgi:hypothetical protein